MIQFFESFSLYKELISASAVHAGVNPSATVYKILIFLTKTNQNIIGNANLVYFSRERLNSPKNDSLMDIVFG